MVKKTSDNYLRFLIFLIILIFPYSSLFTQTHIEPNNDTRVITTGVPFLLIASDARAASLGDMGVATSADTYSQQWNLQSMHFLKQNLVLE